MWHICCIFFSILYCILFTYYFTYFAYATYLAYFFIHIFCISVNVVAYLTYFSAYVSAYFMAYLFTFYGKFMHSLYSLHSLLICAWWHMLQVFGVYFLSFQKNKNDRTAKPGNHLTAKQCKHHLLILQVPLGRFESWSSAQKACCPATDPLGNPHSIDVFYPRRGPTCSRTTTCNCLCRRIAVLCFFTRSARKVGCFSSHPVWYSPCIAYWNKRQPYQYGGHWNHIQDLLWFTALVYYGGLQPSCATIK